MIPAFPAAVAMVAMRFADGDVIRGEDGVTWRRGLRHMGQWATLDDQHISRSDDAIRAALTSADVTYAPALPGVYQPLPGTTCASRGALDALAFRPATGAVLYTASLNRTQSFLGNDHGVMRRDPTPLTLASVRASLQGTLARHQRASITYHRATGRLFARYAVVDAALHTHVYVLTGS
ncbi:hypothetical protein ACIBBE_24740 [Streptomyces sp. NPDC051644]|uniref:hypothetical protein n=1 Tax=Streptomyces sp. NPDC051644 TaxID=3365666 RepID=UPI0037B43C06